MGCASSKQARRDLTPIAPLARSFSLPIHHPAQRKGDSYHVVALTSTTLGSLKLDPSDQNPNPKPTIDSEEDEKKPNNERCNLSTEAKSWSNKMEGKISQIPKTPLRTPPNEPETINAWELMEGLEDCSPLRSFSFHAFSDMSFPETVTRPKHDIDTDIDPVVADFDPEILSNFRKALDELSPPNTCRLKSPEPDNPGSTGRFSRTTVQERIRAFQDRIDEGLAKKVNNKVLVLKCPPRGEERVVIYFTSLRGVRKTYEDCCSVRVIFKGYGIQVDERDVSMHHVFRNELYELLDEGGAWGFGGLPRVFVRGMYLGGAEDVRQMHETGELEKLVEGCEILEGGGGGVACGGCGDVRFVPCDRCCGSCKVFDEDEEVFLRCSDCNENGIVTCPICFI